MSGMDQQQTCTACHRHGVKMLLCGQCRLAYFCNATCQRQIWKGHKPICLAISNPAVDMKKTKSYGNGLFATRSYRRGELIVMEKSQQITKQELQNRNMLLQFGYTLTSTNANETISIHGPIMSLINHACIPNAWVKRDASPYRKLYARKDIAEGDEICTFYDGQDLQEEECTTSQERAGKRIALLERFGLDCVCVHCELDKALEKDEMMALD